MRRDITKSRPIIAFQDVRSVFDEAWVREQIAELPRGTEPDVLLDGVRRAAEVFARDARRPTVNQLHDKIAELHEAAERQSYDRLAELIERLSLNELDCLFWPDEPTSDSPSSSRLPAPADLRDKALRDEACDRIAALCRFGGEFVRGRGRPSPRSPRVLHPFLRAPAQRRNYARRDAELDFVMKLQVTWLMATGKRPAETARHAAAGRRLGPFATFARKCLDRVGAKDADVVELINELHRLRLGKPRRRKARAKKTRSSRDIGRARNRA